MGHSAWSLGVYLQGISNNELGTPFLQNLMDSVGFKTIPRNDTNTANKLAKSLQSKFINFKAALNNIAAY